VLTRLGPVYMRGGTGRLPGRDDERDPGLYKFLLCLSPDVYMEAGRFSSRPGQAGSRFVQPGSRLNRDVFFHVNTCCRDGMEGGMILVY
jgi:hypothetical protein